MQYLSLTLPGGQTIANPQSIPSGGIDKLGTALSGTITLFFLLGIVLVVIYIIWAGAQWSSSGGDKSKLTAARNRLTWAIIGLVVLLLSFLIVNVVGFIFNVDLLAFP